MKENDFVFFKKLDILGSGWNITELSDGYLCFGKVNDKDILIMVSFEKNGWRDFMKAELCGQKESSLILLLADIMRYPPFCKYERSDAFVSYLWTRKNKEKKFNDLIKECNKANSDISRVEKLY
ncbi:MAG: hypothetical protein PHU82_01675 [Candidatus Pacebacteria bacterium]|jgi:hypothetical protein|nr:hypothetical protein [Candidatus Paceibacterota bacterium]